MKTEYNRENVDLDSQAAALTAILDRIGRGDREALARLLVKCGPLIRRRLHGKIRPKLRSLFDTDDLFATTVRRIDAHIANGGSIRADSFEQFMSLIIRTATNSLSEKARRGSARVAMNTVGATGCELIEAKPSSAGISSDISARIERAAESAVDQEILNLCVRGHCLAAVARCIGMREATVRQRLARIRRRPLRP